MDYFSTDHITSRFLMEAGVVVILAIFFHRHSGRRWFAPLFFIAALAGVSYHEGVLTNRVVNEVSGAATDKLDAATLKAKAIGGQAHQTSAGQGGATNEHFKKRVDRKKR